MIPKENTGVEAVILQTYPKHGLTAKHPTYWSMIEAKKINNYKFKKKTLKHQAVQEDMGFLCGLCNFLSCSWLPERFSQLQEQER